MKRSLVDKDQPILILDSGMGGVIVEKRLREEYKHENFVILLDNEFMPYGQKTNSELKKRISSLTKKIKEIRPKAIIVACNTIDNVTLEVITSSIVHIPTISIIKPTMKRAIELSKTKNIAVLATESTIQNQGYLYAGGLFGKDVHIYGVECPNLALAIENNKDIKETFLEETSILKDIEFDTLVLGCTHYSRVNALVNKYFSDKTIVDSTVEILEESKKGLELINKRQEHKDGNTSILLTSENVPDYINKLYKDTEIDIISI
ncbi:MAG: glutamate racemase [Mycoplasmatales bacterium]